MGKLISLLSACLFTLVLAPVYVFAEETGAEEVAAEPSGLLITCLTILGLATIVTMIYHCVRDNG